VTSKDLIAARGPGIEGPGVDIARALVKTATPGQVVLTTDAWTKIQGNAPAGAFPLSLGMHMAGGFLRTSTLPTFNRFLLLSTSI
jgi:hypothetical protein